MTAKRRRWLVGLGVLGLGILGLGACLTAGPVRAQFDILGTAKEVLGGLGGGGGSSSGLTDQEIGGGLHKCFASS